MLNLLATLVVLLPAQSSGLVPAQSSGLALPAQLGGFSACPAPAPVAAEVGECDAAAPLDLWYRMSRFAEPDPASAGAGLARKTQANPGVSCDAPTTPAQLSSPPSAPPVAVFALPTLLPLHVPSHFDVDARDLPARALAPPERPPRA